MKRYLMAVLAASLLAVSILVASGASIVDAAFSCSAGGLYDLAGSGNVYLELFETQNYNIGQDAAHSGVLCIAAPATGSTNIPNLKNVAYTNDYDQSPAHVCDGQLATSYGTWNDCTGSVKASIDCHHSFSLYKDSDYGGTLVWSGTVSAQLSFNAASNDIVSSVKITYHSACQTLVGG